MNRFKCPACGGNQHSATETAEGCIYCGNKELEKMDTLEPEESEIDQTCSIDGVKGFDKDLKCRGFQFEVGKEYEHKGEVRVCRSGFHFCENPMDAFEYYPPGESRYCVVEGDGKIDKGSDDSKVVCSKIRIGAEIGITELVSAGVKFILQKVDWKNAKEFNTDDRSAATNTCDLSAATNTGYWSAATNTGDWSAATNTGYGSAAMNTGDLSAATNTGYRSVATNTGDRSVATNTGFGSVASVEGKESVAMAIGYKSKAKGALGCWIVLAEWDEDGEHIIDVRSTKVDGDIIKADTWYILKDGKFVEEA